MESNSVKLDPLTCLDADCWHYLLEKMDAPTLACAACVSRAWRNGPSDDRLWSPLFEQTWSPESCGVLRKQRDGKNFRTLYNRWQTCKAGAVDLIPGVHKQMGRPCSWLHASYNLQFSRAGPLSVWSTEHTISRDLVCTDMTTCQTRTRFTMEKASRKCSLAVVDSMGVVCTGCDGIQVWDPRQARNGASSSPAFTYPFPKDITCMISAESPEGDGPPHILTGDGTGKVLCWDLRCTDGAPVLVYGEHVIATPHGRLKPILGLAIDRRSGTLLCEAGYAVNCWNLETGAQLSSWDRDVPSTYQEPIRRSQLVLGKECLLTAGWVYGDAKARVEKWPLPDPQAIVQDAKPQAFFPLGQARHVYPDPHAEIYVTCVQGLGEGPDGLLVGLTDGSIRLVAPNSKPVPPAWSLETRVNLQRSERRSSSKFRRVEYGAVGGPVKCMAATDQAVVCAVTDRYGELQVMRMDTPLR